MCGNRFLSVNTLKKLILETPPKYQLRLLSLLYGAKTDEMLSVFRGSKQCIKFVRMCADGECDLKIYDIAFEIVEKCAHLDFETLD